MNKSKKEVGAIVHSDGVTFRVWAPFAKAVAVTGACNDWGKTPLDSELDGYWAGEIKKAEPGQEYKYVITTENGELFRNDPRALQVTTSNGNSVIADTEFAWDGDNFTPPDHNKQVIYELHVGTFFRPDPAISGTFEDVNTKLDYLRDLGINMIELMPISSMAMDRGWGYATDYIYTVEALYGGRRQFLQFVKAAHQRGIGVILDVVYNHIGPDNNLDVWQFDGWSENSKGGIYFYNDWRSSTPWGDTRPDYGRQEVRQYFTDNVRMWLHDCHLDGLRVDSTIFIRNVKGQDNDPSNDLAEGWKLLQEVTSVARKIKPTGIIIGEDVGGNDYITKPRDQGGAGFSAQWEVGFPHILRGALDGNDDAYRNLVGICGALTHKYNGEAFQRVIYTDSHDTAANGGSRLSEEISPGNTASIYARRRSLIASALSLTAPGIPMFFQGQEFMEGGSFNDWQALDWENAKKFSGIVDAHKHLIALRKNAYGNTNGLTGQSVNIIHLNEESKLLAYHRWELGGPRDDVMVVINFANQPVHGYSLGFPRDGLWRVRFNSDWKGYSPDFKNIAVGGVNVETNTGNIDIGPYSVLVLSQDD